ncbi:putative membrane protein YgcG [Brachybacterium muris]|uniref:twin-arginine translocation signal domain-containing protein n=1 Tax=Brachybacterium muris TaxID=219301 RepID=UPI001958350A|nr:twin-arginine translocation signal domain-containing protein [Brachybacterium muris]MBM7502173.1 putative membrane protein YgcG [Brachybacterium muris]MCT1653478.1 twin-arginine translocation signal domain-containing protein [Brachybacterium muris]
MTTARISRRHALAGGAAVTSLAALAACGSDDSGSGGSGSGGSGSDSGSGSGEPVELTY